MKKKIPTFKSDEEAEALVASADLTNYDLSGAKLVCFELKRKDKSINLRLPAAVAAYNAFATCPWLAKLVGGQRTPLIR
jgi:predicted DNA binding CopG/RHH family protein